MINYKPKFGLGCTRPEQTELLSKFGGRRWGLDPACWPTRMALLCQLVHDPPMIDLGGDYVLHVWHWNSPDDYRDPPEYHFHCDYSTLVKRTDLGSGLTTAPKDQCLIGEVFIDGWEELEDNTPAEWLPEFFDESSYSDLQEREVGDIQFGCGLGTKFGGPPNWQGTNAIRNAPKNFDFLFQTDAYIPIQGKPPSKEIIKQHNLTGIMPTKDPDNFIFVITDFACDGSAFLFMDKSQDPPIPHWNWSR